MFSKKPNLSKKSEDVKKSAGKVVDPKRDTPTRAKHLRIFLDNADLHEIIPFFEAYYSHIFYIVYDAFITAEINLRQKGAHKAQREELEAVLYLFEKILLYLPEHLGRKWQYHSVGRLMSKLLHPGNSWKLLKREAMRLFILWYQVLGDVAGEPLHAMFATLVPGFPSPYQGLGLTALAAMTPDTQDGPVNPAEICPLIPPQSGERWRTSPDTDLTRIFLEVLLELVVSQVPLIEWKENKSERQKRCLDFLFDKFKAYYMPHIFPEFNWNMSLYNPSLNLPEVRKFRPAFIDTGDGTKKMDPMLSCRVVVIKWVAQYTHITRSGAMGSSGTLAASNLGLNGTMDVLQSGLNLSMSEKDTSFQVEHMSLSPFEDNVRNSLEGNMVRSVLYANRENVDFVHEVYRQAFLLSFSHSPAIKKVITVYKDWIQMNVVELPPFLLEPLHVDKERDELDYAMTGKLSADMADPNDSGYRLRNDSYLGAIHKEHLAVRAGLQNVLQIFITNAANVFLLEISPEYPILLEEQVEMCKRVLNIYRYMVMNVKMDARTWEQLLFILLQITQLTMPESPPRRREDTLGGRLAQAIFQTLIVTWIKANLYVVVSPELWDQFLEVLSSLTLWEELIREWAKTMETLTRVLARQVYQLDLNDLPLDRLSERAAKKRRGQRGGPQDLKYSSSSIKQPVTPVSEVHPPILDDSSGAGSLGGAPQTQFRRQGSPYPRRKRISSETEYKSSPNERRQHQHVRFYPTNLRRSMSEGYIKQPPTQLIGEYNFHLESKRRHRSVESMYTYSRSESDGVGSRSCSPAPSSGLECTSMKDSPMQLDHDTISEGGLSDQLSHHTIHSSTHHEPRSVMSGGAVKGWLPDVAVVLWRRMLGALGNINHIADTVIHAQIYKYLIELHEIMVKIRNNQGVSLDNNFTPPPPDFVPPFTIFAPWCCKALALPEAYQRGKLYALRLLCLLTCRPHDTPLSKTHLVQFYKVLHEGLTGSKLDVMNTLIKYTGPRFFSLMLPGYTAYILDFLFAANCTISTSELKGVPRTEATSVVGALLAFPSILEDIPLLLPNSHELSLISSADVKDQIIGVLLKSGKKEPAGLARCISLSSLGIFVYSELIHGSFHPKIKEAIQVLLTALRFNNKAVAQIASDMLLLLADHVKNFLDFYPEVPKKIVEVLAKTLISLTPRGEAGVNEDEKRLLLSLLFCLGEWCMRIPHFILTQPQEDGKSLLYHVFEALQQACDPGPQGAPEIQVRRGNGHSNTSTREGFVTAAKAVLSPAVMVSDFDPNIHVDNTKEGYMSNNTSPLKSSKSRSGSQEALSIIQVRSPDHDSNIPVRLAAKTVLSHLVNHLFHFPMSNGAANLSSLVAECDDIPGLGTDELCMDVFQQPNIQLFILNNTTLMSLVELPLMENVNSVQEIQTSSCQVRLILRDISGKFSWDSCAMNGLTKSPNGIIEMDYSKLAQMVLRSSTGSKSNVSHQAMRRRNETVLPTQENAAEDMDNLDDLLQYISHTSPECKEEVGRPLNAVPTTTLFENEVESDVISGVMSQRTLEQDHVKKLAPELTYSAHPEVPPQLEENQDYPSVFQQCRRLFSHLGLSSWEQRPNVHLMKKNERLLRELKNLDAKRCREAHKIAVVFVGEGQEDKQSILSNASGSQAYEEFVSGLAWEVELETHTGFMGGLQKSKTTGETAPYYATSFLEVMFHVATRMPSLSEESMLQKTRHIGNDEIHIVWSEHWRDYRRGILPTEFCDVLIVIYPLKNKLFRIQVSRKPEVPYFGPLFNEMIVGQRVLPGLIRATAINASRAKRSMLTFYQSHYEERSKALENIIANHKDKTTFEEFITQVFSPAPLTNLFQYSGSSSRPASLIGSSSLGSQHLPNVLLDGNQPGTSPNQSHMFSSSHADIRPRTKTEGGGGGLSSPANHHSPHFLALNNNYDEETSPKQTIKQKLTFKASLPGGSAKRPLAIKEEDDLVSRQASPPSYPTRKR
eukprot:maker-scaffold1916_size24942-snap-gene-0.4 protein:Tk07384 transcript:maker-scaffold1916_size24942-snap-gene-0.4-mRNA-1 annotation:"250 kda substrate of akt"